MIKIDLITGFLGAGKTTFIKHYARDCISRGERICILENDFGAVNVDMMLLQDMIRENCDMEMVAGGCDADCHRRRFKTKLISMGMLSYDRVIVEPSGVFDMDEFFDVLREEPLDRWYEIGSVIAIVDAGLDEDMSSDEKYVLATEAAHAGRIVFSHMKDGESDQAIDILNDCMALIKCDRVIGTDDTIKKDWSKLSPADFDDIRKSGFFTADYQKRDVTDGGDFETLYYMDHGQSADEVKERISRIFSDSSYGRVIRIKGFAKADAGWVEINAKKDVMTASPIEKGQEVIIVIGENLDAGRLDAEFPNSMKSI